MPANSLMPITSSSADADASAQRRFIMVLNEESGTVVRMGKDKTVEILRRVFEEEGQVGLTLHCVTGPDLEQCLEQAVKAGGDVLVVGGGDGSVACAATLLAGQGQGRMALGVLPLGTFNLAARDLGMPLDLEEAARALLTAPVVSMDAMELNGRLYLCLMVLGFYPALKMARPEHHGWWLVRAFHTLRDSIRHAATFPKLDLALVQDDGEALHCRTRVVLITNNDYEEVFGVLPQRASLSAGFFSVYVSRHRTRLGLLRSLVAWVLGRWKQDREVQRLQTTELEIHAKRPRHQHRSLPVMMDGEVERLRLPLKITLKPGALKVLAPREAPEAS